MKGWLASTLLLMMMVIVGAGCSDRSSRTVFTADEVPSPTPPPTTQLVVPLTTLAPGPNPTTAADAAGPLIVFERLLSPEIGIAEVEGFGATATDDVTIDGTATTFLSFNNAPEGRFLARVSVSDAGSHTLCIRDTCGVVDVAG